MSSRIYLYVRQHHVALIAIFIALGGTAYAADKIGSRDIETGAVKSKQIGNNKVKSKDLKDGKAVKSRDVKDDGLTGEDIDESTLAIASGAIGPDAFGAIPAARVGLKAANQSIPDQTQTPINFNNEAFDTADIHDESTSNSRLTAPIDGLYYVAASIHWANNADGDYRRIRIRQDGSVFRAANFVEPAQNIDTFHSVASLVELDAGEYLEVVVEQDSGGALNVSLAVGTEATMFWVGPPGAG